MRYNSRPADVNSFTKRLFDPEHGIAKQEFEISCNRLETHFSVCMLYPVLFILQRMCGFFMHSLKPFK